MPFHNNFKFLFFIAFLFLTACQGFQFDPWPDKRFGVHHTVQKGQTLYRIAQAYDIDLEVLRRANFIRDASKIKEGMQLWIPGASRVLTVPANSSPFTFCEKRKNRPRSNLAEEFLSGLQRAPSLQVLANETDVSTKALILPRQKEHPYTLPLPVKWFSVVGGQPGMEKWLS